MVGNDLLQICESVEVGFAGGDDSERDLTDEFGANRLAPTAETRRAYIENLLAVAADDAKNVTLIATVAVAVSAFSAKEAGSFLGQQPALVKVSALLVVSCWLCGAACMFSYAAAVNKVRMDIVRSLVSADALQARQMWASKSGVWRRKGFLFKTGAVLLIAGSVVSVALTAVLFLK